MKHGVAPRNGQGAVNLLLTLSLYDVGNDVCSVLAAVMRLGPRVEGQSSAFRRSTRLEMKAPARSADRISSCAILLAGVVGGVLVFVVALPLALSSPFPTPKQREWIIENSAQADASSFRALPMLPQPMEPLRVDLPVMAAADPPALQSGPTTFAETWSLTVPAAAATAPPVASEAASVDVPAEATRLAPPGKAIEATPPKRPGASNSDPIDGNLWEDYQLQPIKTVSTVDFTGKDP